MSYVPVKRATLLIPTKYTDTNDERHLFVIMNDHCKHNRHLVVNFTSVPKKKKYDKTCIVKAGEHPFIGNDSYVAYRFADVLGHKHIIRCVNNYLYIPHPTQISESLHQRIWDGFEKSKFIKGFVLHYIEELNNGER